jgi:hypothetical protein
VLQQMLVRNAIESSRQNVLTYETISKNTSRNVNLVPVLMSGLNRAMWVYVTPNVDVVEI